MTVSTTLELVKTDQISYYAISKIEAQFIHKEIFTDHCYDIADLPSDAFIVDAGANIGLFSLYMKQKHPKSKILAFEPAPECFNVLTRNLALNSWSLPGVTALQLGLSSKAGTLPLTYFPNLPGNSTLLPEEKNKLYEEAVRKRGKETADARFGGAVKVDVKLERLSDVLREQYPDGPDKIDLLKVDVEGAELDVLKGMDDEHWKLVQNVVVETWEPSGIRPMIEALLEQKGFEFTLDKAEWAPDQFYMITARRR
ncbi:methyltransferase sdnD [Rhypophila decipiens]|uniref:Methyltransferase sdnD n=1 Tax=Rhypophila decipiens TaxID=261697 RepID=A0AAN6Y0Z2_9PEZI|nr:methyltransferase sdnD [Rhypophila decipiens]